MLFTVAQYFGVTHCSDLNSSVISTFRYFFSKLVLGNLYFRCVNLKAATAFQFITLASLRILTDSEASYIIAVVDQTSFPSKF